ncbi:MAG: class I SAM-dependent methyltransferase [Cytophagales bacterium]|nr:class I SAM-dependent methyltransferase [Cytophagales bacterium]
MPGVQYFTTQYDRSLKADYHLDIQQIELPDNQFDVIICFSHVLNIYPMTERQ